MIISECMTKNVLCVRQDETADVAARLLSRGNIGAVPVLDRRDRVVGMLTDRDLVVRALGTGREDLEQTPVRSIMTTEVISVSGSVWLYAAPCLGK